MKEKDFVVEQELRDLYYNPETGFQSAERLYQKAKEEGINVSRRIVKEWLREQDTYTKFKPIVKRHKFRRVFVKDLGDQLQMDLVDMKKFKKENKGYYWILTGIEILSRFAFAIPVYRKDTENMTRSVAKMMALFKKRFGMYPKVIQFDEGKEFYNVGIKSLLRDAYNVKYFSTHTGKKAAIVERFNRTIKRMMWKYFDVEKTHKWLDDLDFLVKNYNNTKHTSIKMKPADVNESNKSQVWMRLFGNPVGDIPSPKFKVGDKVRISAYKNIFTKGYEANFTKEIFKIVEVFFGDPTVYKIKDVENGEEILGKFYQQELSLVYK